LNINNKIIRFDSKSKFDESNVYRLSKLKPAGTKLILAPNTELIELIKLTLFDLNLKQVLIIKKELKRSHPKDPYLREYIIVEAGRNFEKYEAINFERYFTKKFETNFEKNKQKKRFQLKVYLRAIYKDIPSEFTHKKEIINALDINNLFKVGIISSIFSRLKTNHKGNKLKSDFSEYLNEVDNNIENLIINDPNKALELILFLQGNIFLLKNLKFEFLDKLKLTSTALSNNNNEVDQNYDHWLWTDFMVESDLSISDLISDVAETFNSVDDYFDNTSNWDVSNDFDVDF